MRAGIHLTIMHSPRTKFTHQQDPIGAVKPHVILKNFNLRPISVAELTLPNKERYDDLMKDRRSRHYDGEKKVMAGGDVHGDNREGCSSNVQDSRTSTLQQTMPTVAAVKVGGTLPEPCERAEAAPAVPNAGAAPARSCSTEQKSVGSAMPPVSLGDLDGVDTSFGVEAAHDVWADRFVQFTAFVSMHGAAAAEADRLHGMCVSVSLSLCTWYTISRCILRCSMGA